MTRLAPFELHAPSTIDEASALLRHHGAEAAVYCGGTELLLLMKLGFAEPRHLVDVKGIGELRGIRLEGEALSIGAAVTHREIERDPVVIERWPALARMERSIANLRVRNAGTIGGNLCFADPHSDPATFMLACDATFVVRGGDRGERRIAAAEFVRGPYRTALETGELLARIELPPPAPGSVVVHRKLALLERPAATVACQLRIDRGLIVKARIAVGSAGPVPARAQEAEALLEDAVTRPLDSELLDEVGRVAARAAGAVADANGSAEYKEQLVSVLVRRAILEAIERAS